MRGKRERGFGDLENELVSGGELYEKILVPQFL